MHQDFFRVLVHINREALPVMENPHVAQSIDDGTVCIIPLKHAAGVEQHSVTCEMLMPSQPLQRAGA